LLSLLSPVLFIIGGGAKVVGSTVAIPSTTPSRGNQSGSHDATVARAEPVS